MNLCDINAVIFDMDGTLIDTEKLNVRFWIQAGKNMGFDIKVDEVLHIRSLDSRLVCEYLESNHPGLDFQSVREERRRLMKEHVESEGLELKPGVNRILDLLAKEGIKTAVATASRPDHANDYLDMLGIHEKEDAPNGVRSAFDAGCKVAFIPDLTEADDEIRAKAMVFSDLDELAESMGNQPVTC